MAPPPSARLPLSSNERSFWTASWRAVSFRLRRLTLGHIREEPRSARASGVGRIINESSARQILHQDFTRSLAVEAETGDRMITWQDARNLLCLKRKDMMLPWQMLMQLFYTSGGSRPLDFVKLLAVGFCRCQSSQFPLRIFV